MPPTLQPPSVWPGFLIAAVFVHVPEQQLINLCFPDDFEGLSGAYLTNLLPIYRVSFLLRI